VRVRVGCSGWDDPHWRGVFYPEHLPRSAWFAHYAAIFDTVEINNTFYRLPELAAVDRWREQAPAGFRYAVKASRYLTHMKKLKASGEPLDRFLTNGARAARPEGVAGRPAGHGRLERWEVLRGQHGRGGEAEQDACWQADHGHARDAHQSSSPLRRRHAACLLRPMENRPLNWRGEEARNRPRRPAALGRLPGRRLRVM
jgi:hypothetical protein